MKRRTAKNPPSLRVRLSDELWKLLHRYPGENWSEVCRSAMQRRAKMLGAGR